MCSISLETLSIYAITTSEHLLNSGYLFIPTTVIPFADGGFNYCNFISLTNLRDASIHTWCVSCFFFYCVTGLTKNKPQKMQRTGLQSCYSFTVVIQARYRTFHGTRVRIGLLLVWLRITYYKFGRWQRTSTTMKMIYLETTPRRLLPSS